ncbi:MAG: hypothetical protein ABI220_02230 [Candidatus Saccharimonadales bacterium]
MDEYDFDVAFGQLTAPLETEFDATREIARSAAFRTESRPIPEGLILHGVPLGHIALRGDFDALDQR